MFEEMAVLGAGFIFFIIVATIWELVWKGIALWKAARNEHKIWYIAILIVNSLGILPIIYILLHQQKKKKSRK